MCTDLVAHCFTVLETDRLIVRVGTANDVELFHALWTEAQVMANVGFPHGLRITRDELLERLSGQGEAVPAQLLVVELKATGEAIGEAYVGRPDEQGIASPDVKLFPSFWRRGYGTELWTALVAYQFEHTSCEVVQGTPNVNNVASIKMQEAAGAVRVGEDIYHFPEGMEDYTTPVHCYVYQIERVDWERRQGDQADESRRAA